MILEEVYFGDSEEEKRKEIQANLGQHVILRDTHEEWCHCQILDRGYDAQVYRVQIGDGRGERQLHYDDLTQLLVIKNSPNFPRPELSKRPE